MKTILASIIIAMNASSAMACTVFPQHMGVEHHELVARTPSIALVKVEHIGTDAGGKINGNVTFETVDVLKGVVPDQKVMKFSPIGWMYDSELSKSDFDRHRDPEFWKHYGRISIGRLGGVDTTCQLTPSFESGKTYLAFFDGERAEHLHSFELIKHADDAWLGKVRQLIDMRKQHDK
ncbi:MAG: hypothetical protein ABJH63_10650 [Rhizobiaceae bacterium]